jgi:transposase
MTDTYVRQGLRLRPCDRQAPLAGTTIDALLPHDHQVRRVWACVERLDLAPLYRDIQAREQEPGAPAYDPEVLFALCLYGTIDGLASFRDLAEACTRDLAFLWLCGGPAPSYHTLSTFYSRQEDLIDALLIDLLALLREKDLVDLKEVAIDGRKVPANASKETFHRLATLSAHHAEAAARVAGLRQQRADRGSASVQEAARRRAAAERRQRLAAALAKLQERTAERAQGRGDPAQTRTSETDADARKMKMSDGGYRPAYNVQTATDTGSGLIVAVTVVEQASDNGLLRPMVTLVTQNTGVAPQRSLTDPGYMDLDDIAQLEVSGTTVYMPPKNAAKEKAAGKDPYARKRRDGAAVAGWRQRMGTAVAQALYRRRAPVAEGVHAQQSNRGFKRFRLRGLVKAQCEVKWHALAHNLCVLLGTDRFAEALLRARVG